MIGFSDVVCTSGNHLQRGRHSDRDMGDAFNHRRYVNVKRNRIYETFVKSSRNILLGLGFHRKKNTQNLTERLINEAECER